MFHHHGGHLSFTGLTWRRAGWRHLPRAGQLEPQGWVAGGAERLSGCWASASLWGQGTWGETWEENTEGSLLCKSRQLAPEEGGEAIAPTLMEEQFHFISSDLLLSLFFGDLPPPLLLCVFLSLPSPGKLSPENVKR